MLPHMQALCEESEAGEYSGVMSSTRVRYGFAFLDAAAARFYVGSTADDGGRANFTALLTQVRNQCPTADRFVWEINQSPKTSS